MTRACLPRTQTLASVGLTHSFHSYAPPLLTHAEIDNPDALRKYYELLLNMIRVVVSAVFSRGIHNEKIKVQTRVFLAENRPCMVGIFKRFAQIGGGTSPEHREPLCELVKSFMALLTATDFLEV